MNETYIKLHIEKNLSTKNSNNSISINKRWVELSLVHSHNEILYNSNKNGAALYILVWKYLWVYL